LRYSDRPKIFLKYKIFVNLLLLLISSLLIIAILEIALRFTEYKALIREAYGIPAYLFINDNQMGVDLAKGFSNGIHTFKDYEYPVFTNNFGCFDREFNRNNFKEKGYILLVGDSFTWGYSPYEVKWGTLIENLTGKFVAKCGVTGHGTMQELIKAKRIISAIGHSPELIILGYHCNDLNDDYLLPWSTVINGHRVNIIKDVSIIDGKINRFSEDYIKKKYREYIKKKDIKQWIKSNSIIANLIYRALHKLTKEERRRRDNRGMQVEKTGNFRGHYGYNLFHLFKHKEKYPWIKKAFSKHLSNITEFKNLSKRYNSKLLIIFTSAKEDYGSQAFNKIIQHLKDMKIEYLNLPSIFKEYLGLKTIRKLYWKNDGHWNIQGNQFVGIIVSKYLLEKSLINVNEKREKIRNINTMLHSSRLKLQR